MTRLVLAVAIPTVVAGVVGSVGLDHPSIWRDEAATLVATTRPLPALLAMLRNVDLVHGAYYLLLHAWLQLGDGIVWARVLSVIATAAAAGLVAALGARLGSPRTGLVAGLLFAVNPSTSFVAQEARSGALVVAVALLATWFLLSAVERRSWRPWARYGAACVALVALNELAALVVVAHGVSLAWWSRRPTVRPGTRRGWFLAVLPAAVVAGALAVGTSHQAEQVSWIPPTSWTSVGLLASFWTGPNRPAAALVGGLVVLALLPTRSPVVRRVRAVAVPLTLVPPVLLVAVSVLQPLFQVRYLAPTVAGVALLGALGLERLGGATASGATATGRRWLVAALAVLLLLVLVVTGTPEQRRLRTPAGRADDVLASGQVIRQRAEPGDAVLFAPTYRRLDALVDPGSYAGLTDVSLAEGPVAADDLYGTELPLPQVEARLLASDRVWVVGRSGLALSPAETDARTELDLLDRDFDRSTTVRLRSVDVVLFVQRRGPLGQDDG